MRRRRSGSPLRIESLAGWVFADLLLVLFIVGLGTQITQIVKADPTSEPEKATPTVKIGMRKEPETAYLTADVDALLNGSKAARSAEEERLARKIKKATGDLAGEQAAMTLIWGCGPTADVGQPLARAAGRQLEIAQPEIFKGATEKALWDGWSDGSCKKGGIELEVYLYNTKPAAE